MFASQNGHKDIVELLSKNPNINFQMQDKVCIIVCIINYAVSLQHKNKNINQ
jgi:hypothetical protein